MTRAIPRQSAVFDERRNSSRVFPVSHEDVRQARVALDRFRRDDPELVRWIEDGAPRLTQAEHVERFGALFAATGSRRGRGRA